MHPLVAGLLVVICTGALVYRSNALFNTSSVSSTTHTTAPKLHTQQAKTVNVSQLAALNLFGEAKTGSAYEQQPEQQDIPETRLKLVLQGSFTSTENDVSSALIATDNRGQARRYFIGDEVPGNALLHDVQPQYVVLKRGGRLEKLLFPREQAAVSNPDTAGSKSTSEHVKKQRAVNRGSEDSLKNRLQQLREQLNQTDENIRI